MYIFGILKFSFLTIEIVEERGKALFSECISVPYNERSHEEYTFLSSHDLLIGLRREREGLHSSEHLVCVF